MRAQLRKLNIQKDMEGRERCLSLALLIVLSFFLSASGGSIFIEVYSVMTFAVKEKSNINICRSQELKKCKSLQLSSFSVNKTLNRFPGCISL